jgi:ABC-type Fe3+/spermidine/putrescine transport system ATPase subunit
VSAAAEGLSGGQQQRGVARALVIEPSILPTTALNLDAKLREGCGLNSRHPEAGWHHHRVRHARSKWRRRHCVTGLP